MTRSLSNVFSSFITDIRNELHYLLGCLKKLNIKSLADIYLYIVAFIFPILPTYFVIAGIRVSTIVAVGCLLLLITTPQIRNIRLNTPRVIIVLAVVTTFVSPSIMNGELLSLGFISYFCTYIVIPVYFAVLVDSKEKFNRCVNVMLVSACIIGVFSLTELFGFNIFSLIETVDLGRIGSSTVKRFGVYRIESSFGQAIAYSIYLSFIICLIFYKLIRKSNQSDKKQNIFLIMLLFFDGLTVLSGSRFPLMLIVVLHIILFFMVPKKSKIKIGIGFGVIVLLVVILSIATGGSLITSIINNIIAIFSGDKSQQSENPFAYRLSLLNYSKLVVGDQYFFGRGLHANETFFITSKYGGLFENQSFDNGYLSIYVTQGIVGLLSWLIFCHAIITSGILMYHKKNKEINFVIVTMTLLYLANLFSVARLDESRLFVIIAGCYLGLDYNVYSKPKYLESDDAKVNRTYKSVLYIRTNDGNMDSRVQKEINTIFKLDNTKLTFLGWKRDGDNTKNVITEDNGLYVKHLVDIYGPWGAGKKNFFALLRFMFFIRKWFKDNIDDYDVVHCVDLPTAYFVAPIAKQYNKFVIYDIFDYFGEVRKYPFLIKKFFDCCEKRTIKNSDVTIICTEERRKQIPDVKDGRILVIHNSPDIRHFDKSKRADNSRVKFCYIGNLNEDRYIPMILEYFVNNKEYDLEIGGLGALSNKVEEVSKENDNIVYHGPLDYDNVLKIENECDVLIALYDPKIPNHKYVAPNKLYEALALGKQLISLKDIGLNYYFENYPLGTLIEEPTLESFSNGVDRLISDKSNWSKNGEKLVDLYNSDYSWAIMENRLLNLYKEAEAN